MKKLLAVILLGFALVGGVAAVSTMNAPPALAGCPNNNC